MNGDSFLDINLDEFIKFHVQNKSTITIASTYVADETRYGFLKLSENSEIIDFQEKPLTPLSGWINCGIYLVKMNLIKENKQQGAFSLEKDFFPFYLGNKTQAFMVEGKFIDIGTPESYKLAQSILSKN
jgi:NDP-sugar pyrophosphorylase family protein